MADEEQKRIFFKNLNKYLSLFNKTQFVSYKRFSFSAKTKELPYFYFL